jgi:hypothetical protein
MNTLSAIRYPLSAIRMNPLSAVRMNPLSAVRMNPLSAVYPQSEVQLVPIRIPQLNWGRKSFTIQQLQFEKWIRLAAGPTLRPSIESGSAAGVQASDELLR